LLEQNPDKIKWLYLSNNPSKCAIRLLGKNPDKITSDILFQSPHIFTYDYKQMKYNCLLFKDDLMKNRFHPRNISKFKDWGVNGFDSVFE